VARLAPARHFTESLGHLDGTRIAQKRYRRVLIVQCRLTENVKAVRW
jgi:hypothetical protein